MGLIRVAELLGRLLLAYDLANDFPHGKAVRSTVLSVELARRAGTSDEDLRDVFWVTLLGYLGGTGFAHEEALVGVGDDRSVRNAMSMFSADQPLEGALGALRRLAPDLSFARRLQVIASILGNPQHPGHFQGAVCDTST